jgi:hypothetical protein
MSNNLEYKIKLETDNDSFYTILKDLKWLMGTYKIKKTTIKFKSQYDNTKNILLEFSQ